MKKAKKQKTGLTLQTRNAMKGYLFMSPWIIGFFAFVAYPVIYSVILSLNLIKLYPDGTEYTWVGLDMFDFALNGNALFSTALTAHVTMIGYMTPIILVFSLIIALLLNGKFPMRAFFRGAFFMPVIIMSGDAIYWLLGNRGVNFEDTVPLVYKLLRSLPELVSTPMIYVLNNLVLILWFCGVQILIFLAGLQTIGSDLYEAASIDGAGGWEKFWKITLPHLSPMILISGVYTVVDIANYTRGSVNTLINEQIFHTKYLYSYSSAMAWMFFLVVALILVVLLLIFKFFGRKATT
jgi:ABC-type sugar transport system permease subunit